MPIRPGSGGTGYVVGFVFLGIYRNTAIIFCNTSELADGIHSDHLELHFQNRPRTFSSGVIKL
jgi:hypothetical protein